MAELTIVKCQGWLDACTPTSRSCPSMEGKLRKLSRGVAYYCDSCAPREISRCEDGIRRSDAANRAVATKRKKYKEWPTRKGQKMRPSGSTPC